MRFIRKKNVSPSILSDHIVEQNEAGLTARYEGTFKEKQALNDILREEQYHICCYCLQRISHFHLPAEGGSHNEHLVPQHGPHGNLKLDLEYKNIFACCNYSIGKDLSDSHCGQHKADNLIHPFILEPNCRSKFSYNYIGEILPQGIYKSESEYLANKSNLSSTQLKALEAILILNLNHPPLKEKRKRIADEFLKLRSNFDRQKAQNKIQSLNTNTPLIPFVEMIIYFLNQIK